MCLNSVTPCSVVHSRLRQVVRLLDMEPPGPSGFDDVYLVTELMETDLSKVIGSRQALSPQHVQYFMYQVQGFVVMRRVFSQVLDALLWLRIHRF